MSGIIENNDNICEVKLTGCEISTTNKYHEIKNGRFTNSLYYCCNNCFYREFWNEYIELKDSGNSVRVNHEHYFINPDAPAGLTIAVGHGGSKFIIKFNDGKIVVSRNLWSQGSIPEWAWNDLPDNAVFLPWDTKVEE